MTICGRSDPSGDASLRGATSVPIQTGGSRPPACADRTALDLHTLCVPTHLLKRSQHVPPLRTSCERTDQGRVHARACAERVDAAESAAISEAPHTRMAGDWPSTTTRIPTWNAGRPPPVEDLHFSTTAERIYTETVVAHAAARHRRPTVGRQLPLPFTFGPWTFAHNGTVTAFDRLQAGLISETAPRLNAARQGKTDSEHAFFWLLSRMANAGIDLEGPAADLSHLLWIVSDAIRELAHRCLGAEKPAKLNFVLSDGRHLVASRWNNTLHYVVREGVRDCEICGIPHIHHQSGVDYRAIVVASEPISHEDWREVPNHSILGIGPKIALHQLDISSGLSHSAAREAPP